MTMCLWPIVSGLHISSNIVSFILLRYWLTYQDVLLLVLNNSEYDMCELRIKQVQKNISLNVTKGNDKMKRTCPAVSSISMETGSSSIVVWCLYVHSEDINEHVLFIF